MKKKGVVGYLGLFKIIKQTLINNPCIFRGFRYLHIEKL